MGQGYVRQSAGDILDGQPVTGPPLADEFNALDAAFHGTNGHAHDGTSGEGPLINLTTSVTGILPPANGGTGASSVILNKLDATASPTANDDTGDGYSVGSRWIDITNDAAWTCVDATLTTAIWVREANNTAGFKRIALVHG